MESEIREKVQSDIGRTQRDYMLRQQLEAIRQELGEAEDSETESIPVYAILRARPALLDAMLLPPGYMAFFSGDTLTTELLPGFSLALGQLFEEPPVSPAPPGS